MDVIRTTAAYSMGEAAHYLNLPPTTLRAWCLGQRGFRAVIRLDGRSPWALSFLNLVEAHVLAAIRREHKVPLPAVRKALKYVQDHLDLNRPLVQAAFETDGVSLFVERLGLLINASKEGQTAMREILQAHLKRIERDGKGLPIKLFLFTRRDGAAQAPSPIVVDPRISFGRPVLVGRSVPTAVLADRFKAGDSLKELAEDYEAPSEAIEEAIRCELDRQAA
ncbi:MAG: DUF433 domain-containing protein [Steroidobacteraceae bacterium]